MCHPAALAVIGGVQAGMQALGQQQQARMQYQAAKQQAEMQRRLNQQAIETAQMRAGRQVTGEVLRGKQQEEAIDTELRNIALKTQASMARERVAAGEAGGIVGQSQTAVINEYMAQEADMRRAYLRQQEMDRMATAFRVEDIGLGLSQFQYEKDPRRILDPTKPRGFGLQDVIGIGTGALSGYMTGREMFPGSSSGIKAPTGTTREVGRQGLRVGSSSNNYRIFI